METTKDKPEPELVQEEEVAGPTGCGILGRYPILSVLTFALIGGGLGYWLANWEPDDPETKDIALQWIGLIGDLFIRALKAIVLPLVFVNVVISVVDMIGLGEAGSVGTKTIILYTITTLIASVIGLIAIVSFRSTFTAGEFEPDPPVLVTFGCNSEDQLITEMDDGTLMCMADSSEDDTQFSIQDLSGSFVRSASGPSNDISLSDTIYDGVFTKLITSNIFFSFVDSNFAAVIVFAIVFGVALGRVMLKRGFETSSYMMMIFQELSQMFLMMINWIIAITPFAVLSLIANAVGSQDDLAGAFSNVGYLILASFFGFGLHILFTDIILFAVLTRSNPFAYLRHIIPAQTTALACASSAATLPVTLRCVKNTGMVPDEIRNFVCPLGATINMDGSAIYFPCACVWLAYLNGIEPNVGNYILLVILSTVGSVGTAPVPSSALVLIITAYNTVFGGSGTPNGFEFIVAIDWFLDRCITALNVTGDTVVCRIIASRLEVAAMKAGEDFEAGEVVPDVEAEQDDVASTDSDAPNEA